MKAVILAGGLGTRLAEETVIRPKPMIEIGGRPILWHIMRLYAHHGVTEFIICLGYKGYMIKEYFANYFLHSSDVTLDLARNKMEVHQRHAEPWQVTLIDTGEKTQTGGRLKRVRNYIGDEDFCMTYGDGIGDVDMSKAIAFHKSHGKLATITAVHPPGRFGALDVLDDRVLGFREKADGDGAWINGGFFVLSPKTIDYIENDNIVWEHAPLEMLAKNDQLRSFCHESFWHPMDTLRDRNLLDELWNTGKAPWKV